jgi:hypothetical protein
MDFEDLILDCLNVLSQHSHGENKKYDKYNSGNLMTQLYSQGVKVTDYAHLYRECQVIQCVDCSHARILLSGTFRNGGCFTPHLGKKNCYLSYT